MNLNLKGWKKKAVEKDVTVLENKEGHQLRLAHKALSKDMREELESLPMSKDKSQKLADGGMVADKKEKYDDKIQRFDDGGGVQPESSAAKALDDSSSNSAPITINISHPSVPDSLINPIAGQASKDFAQSMGQPTQDSSPQFQDTFGVSKEQQAQMLAPSPSTPAPVTVAPDTQMPQAPAANADPYGMDAYANTLNRGIGEQKSGILGEAQAAGREGALQNKALQEGLKQQQARIDNYDDHYGELDKERKAFQQDVENAHVDPHHYFNSIGTGGKIATAIGLIIGGLGGSDAPIKFMNQQIDRDIEAQKSELGKKENLLSANMKQFGNLRDATDMTRLMQSDIITNKLKQAAAQAATPMAQASALKAIGALDRESAGLQQQMAVRRTMLGAMSGATQDPAQMGQVIQAMRQLNPEMAKSMEERYVPGVGSADIPVPQAAREAIIAKQTLHNAAQDLMQYSQTHTNIIPGTADYNYGVSKALALQQKIREGLLGTVFRESEKPLLEKFIKENPAGALKAVTVQPQLRAIMDSNRDSLNTLKHFYGLPTPQIDFKKK